MTGGDALTPEAWVMRARRVAERSGEDIRSPEWVAKEREIGDSARRAETARDREGSVSKRIDDLLRSTTGTTPDAARAVLRAGAERAEAEIAKRKGRIC